MYYNTTQKIHNTTIKSKINILYESQTLQKTPILNKHKDLMYILVKLIRHRLKLKIFNTSPSLC